MISEPDAYVGLDLTAARARAEADGMIVRIIQPGMRYTMEYRDNRINLTLDGETVVKATIG
jgi:hypothetical protein